MASTTTTTVTAAPTLNAENVIRVVPEVDPSLAASHRAPTSHDDLAGYDEEQIRLMDEVCIVLDHDDKPIGSASKKVCHKIENIEKGLLHRAFSVFLFDPDSNRMLLQQRATEKITFPDLWTNTCCSHPLGVPGETGAELAEAVLGVKRAAQRKLDQELGIKKEQVPIDQFQFLTRIHYKSPSGDDGIWGEHEIDYILFIRPQKPVTLAPNPNEIRDHRYVSQDELKAMFNDPSCRFTPWFKLICNSMLFEWWSNLEKGSLDKYMNEQEIRRML